MPEFPLHHPTILAVSVLVGFILASRQMIFGFYTYGSRSSRDLAVSTFLFTLLCVFYLLEPHLPGGFRFIPSSLLVLCLIFIYRAIRQEFGIAANDRFDVGVAVLAVFGMVTVSLTLDLAPRVLLFTLFVVYFIGKAAILALWNRQNVPPTTFRGMFAFFLAVPAPFIIYSVRLMAAPQTIPTYSQGHGSALTTGLMLLFFTALNFSVQISASIRNADEITDLLDTAVEEKDFANRLVSIISHDLRGYMGNLRTASGIVEDRNDPAVPLIEEYADRAESLLTDLVCWGRSRSASVTKESADDIFPAATLLDAAIGDVTRHAESRGIVLEKRAVSGFVRVDSVAVRVILRNLLSNALKYSPSEGTIRLSAERDDESVLIRVSDSGPGMSESLQEEIRSGRFVRPETGHHGEKGTGTGLSIVTSVCEAHGWDLEIDSCRGDGTTFTLRLPAEGIT